MTKLTLEQVKVMVVDELIQGYQMNSAQLQNIFACEEISDVEELLERQGIETPASFILEVIMQTGPMKPSRVKKNWWDVKVGDLAVDCQFGEAIGHVLAKGSFSSLTEQGYMSTMDADDFEDMMTQCDPDQSMDKIKCVAVSQDPTESMEGFSNLIYFYNYDPCSVVCYK